MANEYEGIRRIVYGDGATFVPVCVKCGRFVTPAETILFDGNGQPLSPHADCSHCGPTKMPFEGYV